MLYHIQRKNETTLQLGSVLIVDHLKIWRQICQTFFYRGPKINKLLRMTNCAKKTASTPKDIIRMRNRIYKQRQRQREKAKKDISREQTLQSILFSSNLDLVSRVERLEKAIGELKKTQLEMVERTKQDDESCESSEDILCWTNRVFCLNRWIYC